MSGWKIALLCVVCAIVAGAIVKFASNINSDTSAFSITIDGPSSVVVGEPIEYNLTIANKPWFLTQPMFVWGVMQGQNNVSFRQIADNDILFTTGPNPTTYTVFVSGALYYNYFFWGKMVPVGIWVKQVTVGNNPIPPKPPTPAPPGPPLPGPTPVNGKLFGVAVMDMNNLLTLPASQQAIHTSETIEPSLTALNTTWRIYDKQNPAMAKPGWQKRITSIGIPLFVVHDPNGNVLYSDKLPVDEPTLIEIVKKFRGQ